jgi:hypothetical protein
MEAFGDILGQSTPPEEGTIRLIVAGFSPRPNQTITFIRLSTFAAPFRVCFAGVHHLLRTP